MATSSQDELTLGTIDAFQLRLRRIEYLLSGRTREVAAEPADHTHLSVTAHISQLENDLEKLAQVHRPTEEILQLYKLHPEVFVSNIENPSTGVFTLREQLAVINACATSFTSTASQLKSIQDFPIPSTDASANLILLQPRLLSAERRQAQQTKELEDLRLQTACLLQRWYDVIVMAGNECWSEWEERLTDIEREIRQREARRESDKGPI